MFVALRMHAFSILLEDKRSGIVGCILPECLTNQDICAIVGYLAEAEIEPVKNALDVCVVFGEHYLNWCLTVFGQFDDGEITESIVFAIFIIFTNFLHSPFGESGLELVPIYVGVDKDVDVLMRNSIVVVSKVSATYRCKRRGFGYVGEYVSSIRWNN